MTKIDTSVFLPSGLQHNDRISTNELTASFKNPLGVWLTALIMHYFNHSAITDYDTNLPQDIYNDMLIINRK